MFEDNESDFRIEPFKKFKEVTILEAENDLEKNKLKVDPDRLFTSDCSISVREYDKSFNEVLHFHDYLEIKYVLSGEVELSINGKKSILKEGQVMLVEKGCIQQFREIEESSQVVGFLFKNTISSINQLRFLGRRENHLVFDYLNGYLVKNESEALFFSTSNLSEITDVLKNLIVELTASIKHKELINSLVDVLFHRLSRVYYLNLSQIYREKDINWTIIFVLKKIENECESLTLAGLSEEMGYNMNYLSNLIKEKTGKTFKNLISEVRIKKAYELIVKTNLPMKKIAKNVGYSNRSYFYMKFEEYYGNTPLSFRKKKVA